MNHFKVNDAKSSLEDDFYDSLYDYDDESTIVNFSKSHSKIDNDPKRSHSKGQYIKNNHHTKSSFEHDTKSYSETKNKHHKNKYLSEYKHRNKISPNKHFSKELFSEFSGDNVEDSCLIKCRKHEALEAELERLIRINEAIKE